MVPQNDGGGSAGGEGLNKMLTESKTATAAGLARPKNLLLDSVN